VDRGLNEVEKEVKQMLKNFVTNYIQDTWKIWRCHLRFAFWDDCVVTAVLLLVPLLGAWIAWQSLSMPTVVPANPNVKSIDDVPVSVRIDVERGCVVYRRLGPTN
jgi:hypothetical protein